MFVFNHSDLLINIQLLYKSSVYPGMKNMHIESSTLRTAQSLVFKAPCFPWLSTQIDNDYGLFKDTYYQPNARVYSRFIGFISHLKMGIARVINVLHSSLFPPRITIMIKGVEYGR